MISSTRTLKLKTSDFSENFPVIMYSRDMYPLWFGQRRITRILNEYHFEYSSKEAYTVPTTLMVLSSIWFRWNILAVPKSEIFGFISSSRSILAALRSLWMTLRRESWWRYKSPRATPIITDRRFSQPRDWRISSLPGGNDQPIIIFPLLAGCICLMPAPTVPIKWGWKSKKIFLTRWRKENKLFRLPWSPLLSTFSSPSISSAVDRPSPPDLRPSPPIQRAHAARLWIIHLDKVPASKKWSSSSGRRRRRSHFP